MTKMIPPKCPYCKTEYQDKMFQTRVLSELATDGCKKEGFAKCWNCGKEFRVTCNVVFYSSKIK